MKKIILSIIAFLAVASVSAHAVFIETTLNGTKGVQHTVKVVYGEPDEHEDIGHWWWYKEGTDVKLTLTKADGTKEILALTPTKNALVASFTPEQDGFYHVSIQHNPDRREGAKTQYQINAVATIQVGKAMLGNKAAHIGNELFVYSNQVTAKNKKEVSLTLYEKGKPAGNIFFQIIAPSGWIKWVKTDDDGIARFIPEWKGKYFAEVSKKEKVQGQSFEEYSRATSMSFEVK